MIIKNMYISSKVKRYAHHFLTSLFSFIAISFVALTTACSKDNEVIEFAIDTTTLDFNAEGGKQSLHLSADDDWTVTSDVEWCLVSPTNGVESTVCEVRVDTSYLYSRREGHLNFHCGNKTRQLTISQFGYEKVILLDKSEISVPDFTDYDELFEEIKVQTNVPYEVIIEYPDAERSGWLSVSIANQGEVQSVPRGGKVRIDYTMYLDSDRDREANVVFRQTNAKQGETPVETRLKFRQTKAQEIIPSREGDSLALLALSRIMRISTNWDTSQSMIYWNNISLEDVTYYNQKQKKTVTEPRVVAASFTMFNTSEGIPFHIRYLDQLRELSFIANSNAHIKDIDLGDNITYLSNLKYLTLLGYGISRLPERMKEMDKLQELDLSGNNLTEIPIDIISALDKKSLRYINLANNRKRDVFGNLYANAKDRAELGIHGEFPESLLHLKNIRYIGLSYNYLEGQIPNMGYDASKYATLEEKIAHNPVMPQLEQLSVNLNFLSGDLPDWLLYHPNLRCWDPYTLVFNQYERSRDSRGNATGFNNEPSSVEQACHLWDSNPDEFTHQSTFNAKLKYETRIGAEYR